MNTAQFADEERVIAFGRDEWLAMKARKYGAVQAEPAPETMGLDPLTGYRLLARGLGFILCDEASRFWCRRGFDEPSRFWSRLANRMLES